MRRGALLLLVLILAISAGGRAAAQSSTDEPASLDTAIQILSVEEGDESVSLTVAVPVSIGELAPTVDNFGIIDGGTLVELSSVRPVTNAVDAVVVLDTSGSMQGDALDAAKQAAAAFIQQAPNRARISVVSFGETVQVEQEPTTVRAGALASVTALDASGETALWDALVTAAELIDGADEPYIVVLSDGEDTVSSATQAEAIRELRSAGAGFYAVAIESSETDLVALEETAQAIDGQYFDTADVGELEGLYTDIAGRLASRYELTFPTTRTDGRTVVVSVAVDDGAVATARAMLGEGAGQDADTEEAAPQILNVPDDSQIGTVRISDPGFLGGSTVRWVGAGLLFTAFALGGILMTIPSTERVLLERAASADRVSGFNNRLSLAADRFISARDEEGGLDKTLDAAGLNLRPGEFVILVMAAVAGVSLIFAVIGGSVTAAIGAGLTVLAAFVYLGRRADRRRNDFADQLVDTLTLMIGSLRAGRGLPQAIEIVAQEAPSPTDQQFQRVVFETRVGRDMTESVLSVADRMRSQELEWVARALDINRELGGDVTEMLGNVVDTIRDRRRVARQVRALSAEGRASGWVMLALPFVVFFFMLWRTPDNAGLLFTHPTGRVLGVIGLAGMVAGYFWIRRLVDLKY